MDWKPELHLGSDKNLTLFGDGIEYHDPKNKSDGYTVIEGATDTSIIISYSETQNHHKNARRTGRQEQSDKEVKNSYLIRELDDVHRTRWTTKRDRGVVSNGWVPDVEYYLCFTATLRSARLSNPAPYSDYQIELHDIIQNLHDEGLGYRKIAVWLNENGYQTPRGKRFFNNHVYSILKKKRLRDERLTLLPEDSFEIGPLRIEYVERKFINSI